MHLGKQVECFAAIVGLDHIDLFLFEIQLESVGQLDLIICYEDCICSLVHFLLYFPLMSLCTDIIPAFCLLPEP